MESMKTRKSWREKLENPPKGLPKVVSGPEKWKKRFGGRNVLVPTPLLVDELIRKIPKGKLVTVKLIRERLAKDFRADATCPLTTGIFIRISAEAAEEDMKDGRKHITPWWRVIRDDGSLNPKLPGGGKIQAKKLKAEGHNIELCKGKYRIVDFEKNLQKL